MLVYSTCMYFTLPTGLSCMFFFSEPIVHVISFGSCSLLRSGNTVNTQLIVKSKNMPFCMKIFSRLCLGIDKAIIVSSFSQNMRGQCGFWLKSTIRLSVHRELNDGLSSGIVDSDGQPLLRAILSQNPNVFHSYNINPAIASNTGVF